MIRSPSLWAEAVRWGKWPKESGIGICEAPDRHLAFDTFTAYDEAIEPFPPGKAYPIRRAKVRVGDVVTEKPVAEDDQEVTFQLQLNAGETELQTWFATEDGLSFGANYVYVKRMSE